MEDSLRSLLDYECLLFHRDCLGSDLRVGHFFSFRCPLVNTPQLKTQLFLRMNQWIHEWTLFYNSGRTEERPPPRIVRLLLSVSSVATKRVSISGQRFDFYKCIHCYETRF
jgi:hypothetical protein